MRIFHVNRILTVVVVLLAAAGCSSGQPPPIPTAEAATVAAVDGPAPSESVLDLRTPASTADGANPGAIATGASAPPSTGSAAPLAPTSVTTSPTAATEAASSAPTATSTVPTTPSTSGRPTTTVATTLATTTTTTTASTTGRPAGPLAAVVEFRIPPGTGSGPWNRFEAPVVVSVGQTLRIHNDDSIAHTVHSNGAPFRHGRSIPPGGFADHPIVEPVTPTQGAPTNYDHDAGTGAAFWVVSRTAIPPTTATTIAPTTAPETTVPPTTATTTPATGGTGPAELVTAEAESLRLLNELRTGLGLQPVSPSDQEMHAFARAWSLEMRNTGFRHSDPPRWYENIVWYSDENMTPKQAAAQFHDMWVNSSGHYRNMTNPDWSIVGVGMWHDETGWWGVHVFR